MPSYPPGSPGSLRAAHLRRQPRDGRSATGYAQPAYGDPAQPSYGADYGQTPYGQAPYGQGIPPSYGVAP